MSTHFRIPCPGCNHRLKIRTMYIGRKVNCKHCGKAFRAQAPPAESAGADAPADQSDIGQMFLRDLELSSSRAADKIGLREGPARPNAIEVHDTPATRMTQLETGLSATGGEARELARSLEAERLRSDELQRELVEAEAQLRDLRQQLDAIQGRAEEAKVQALGREAEERDSIAAERDRLQAELAAVREESEARAAELDRLGAVSEVLAATRAERDRLAAEVPALRAEREARAVEAARLREAEAGRDSMRAELEHLSEELRAVRSELDAADRRGRAAASAADELRARLDERERSTAEASAQLVAERDDLAHALGEAREASEAARRDLAERTEQQARAEAEVQRLRERSAEEGGRTAQQLRAAEEEANLHRLGFESARRELDDASGRLKSLGWERDALRARLEAVQGAHWEEVGAVRRAAEVEAAAHRERIGELEAALAAAEAGRARAVKDAETTLATFEGELAEVRTQLRAAVERGDRLEQESRSGTETASGVQEVLASARRRVTELEAKLVESQQAMTQVREVLRSMGVHLS